MPTVGGEARMSGGTTARKVNPAELEKARAAVEKADATVWATARYEGGKVSVRLGVAVPYEAPEGERLSTMTVDLDGGGRALEDAFEDILDARLPDLVYRGKRAAAESMLRAAQDALNGGGD